VSRMAKRFWKRARAVPAPEAERGHMVQLDGRPLCTPAGAVLVVPGRALAEALAAEWDAQGETVDPGSMPLTRIANSAQDKVAGQKAGVVDHLVQYGDTDLLCYRADAPAALAARQAAGWDPYLDWAARELGARLHPRQGIMHRPQDAEALARLRERVQALGHFTLAGFADLVTLSGSLVLAFATIHRFRPPADVWAASRIDETWQIEQWGEDEEARLLSERKFHSFRKAAEFVALVPETCF